MILAVPVMTMVSVMMLPVIVIVLVFRANRG
jgi:hypothetical protein